MTLTDLIAALEAADGPSRELDAEIANLLGLTTSYWPGKEWEYRDGGEWRPLPAYTTSLDAARSLSDWVLIHAGDISADGLAQVILGNPATTPVGEVEGIHQRLEIAWCIAALKTREFDKGER